MIRAERRRIEKKLRTYKALPTDERQSLQAAHLIHILKSNPYKDIVFPIRSNNALSSIPRLVDGGDGHDIACKIDGIGAINLKSEFVKKA